MNLCSYETNYVPMYCPIKKMVPVDHSLMK